MKLDKRRVLFITSALIIIALIVYLGSRAIKHEILFQQYQTTQLTKSRMNAIEVTIHSLLEQKTTYIEAITNFIEPTNSDITTLLNNEIDIKNGFIINRHHDVIYPNDTLKNTNHDTSWLTTVSAIAQDPSVLYAHYVDSEQSMPLQGWYLTYDSNGPILIYWINKQNNMIGFQVSYVKLLLDLISTLDDQTLTDCFIIKDNGQIIYDNNMEEKTTLVVSDILPYPLTNWQLDYFYQDKSNTMIYMLGGGVLIILSLSIVVIFTYSYREYCRAARLAMQQVNFVGQVSHEFKTPLTNITLYSEMLKERLEDEPAPIPAYLDIITQESQRLTRLIQNVLNFTKSSKIIIQPIYLNALLQQNCQIFAPILANKNMTLNFTPYLGKDLIDSDGDKLIQIVNNLLSNAEKYAAKGRQIDLTIARQDNVMNIIVRDYGEGIPPQSLSEIFKPFYRLNSSLTEGVSGTGIGLTIAKQLAAQLQGDISVKNVNPGAQFTLTLPIKMSHKDAFL